MADPLLTPAATALVGVLTAANCLSMWLLMRAQRENRALTEVAAADQKHIDNLITLRDDDDDAREQLHADRFGDAIADYPKALERVERLRSRGWFGTADPEENS